MRSYRTDPADSGTARSPDPSANARACALVAQPRHPASDARRPTPRRPDAPTPRHAYAPTRLRARCHRSDWATTRDRVARPGVFATLETPGAARIAPHGSRRAAQARRLGRSHDRVPFWRRFSGRRHHRVPKGALYDLKYPQRHLCPTSLLRTVTVGTLCRCPAAVGQLPTRTMALGPVPGASAKHAMTRLIHWRIACRCRAAGRRDLRSCPALVCLAMEAARWVPGRGALWQRCVSGPGI
jgi:hypothetical protein